MMTCTLERIYFAVVEYMVDGILKELSVTRFIFDKPVSPKESHCSSEL
jgi:hypothetical protein